MGVMTSDTISMPKPTSCVVCGHSRGLLETRGDGVPVCFLGEHPMRPVLVVEPVGPLLGHDPLADEVSANEVRAGRKLVGANVEAMKRVRAADPEAFRQSESRRPLFSEVHEVIGDPSPKSIEMKFDALDAAIEWEGRRFAPIPALSGQKPLNAGSKVAAVLAYNDRKEVQRVIR